MKIWLPKAYRNWLARQQKISALDRAAWESHKLIRKGSEYVCKQCNGDCGQCGIGGHVSRYERELKEIKLTPTR